MATKPAVAPLPASFPAAAAGGQQQTHFSVFAAAAAAQFQVQALACAEPVQAAAINAPTHTAAAAVPWPTQHREQAGRQRRGREGTKGSPRGRQWVHRRGWGAAAIEERGASRAVWNLSMNHAMPIETPLCDPERSLLHTQREL
jgi:hypothetical protein